MANNFKRNQVWVSGGDHKNGGYHMIRNDAFEPQRTNNFELHISGLSELKNYFYGNDNKGGTHNANTKAGEYNEIKTGYSDVITLSVKGFDPPNFSNDVLNVSYGNNKVKYAGVPTFGNVPLTCQDFIGLGTIEILTAWQRAVYDIETETIGLSSEYKKTAYLYEFAPNGDLHRSWLIDGLWPSGITFGSFSQDGGLREVSATLEYDYCKPENVTAGNSFVKSPYEVQALKRRGENQ